MVVWGQINFAELVLKNDLQVILQIMSFLDSLFIIFQNVISKCLKMSQTSYLLSITTQFVGAKSKLIYDTKYPYRDQVRQVPLNNTNLI